MISHQLRVKLCSAKVYIAVITLHCAAYTSFVIGGNSCFMILAVTKSVAINTVINTHIQVHTSTYNKE